MSRPRIRFGDGRVLQFRLELEGIAPVIWRRLLVSGRASLAELHGVIRNAIGPDVEGAYRFEVDGVHYVDPEEDALEGAKSDTVSVDSLGLHPGSRLLHIAEHHGDPWNHVITLEQTAPRLVGQRLPACIAGGRAAPPDECAGPAAYRELLEAIADPTDPRAAELRSWLPEQFDPDYANIPAINAALARLPKHRPAA